MSVRHNILTIANTKERSVPVSLERFPHYAICVGLGSLGGIIGVTLVIGFVVLSQLLFFQSESMIPNIILLMGVTAVVSYMVTWAVSKVVQFIMPSLAHNFGERSWQVVFVFSMLASLVELPLLLHGLY